ncbi:MAG: hypothetical protein R2771_00050 [Saprospiraceae bacterium]
MDKYSNVSLRKYLIIIIIGIPLLLYMIVFNNKQGDLFEKLDKEGVIDTAVVVRDFVGAKGRQYFEYQFRADNKVYSGFLKYSPSYGDLHVNDSVLIKYLESDPDDINRVLQHKDKKVVKIY